MRKSLLALCLAASLLPRAAALAGNQSQSEAGSSGRRLSRSALSSVQSSSNDRSGMPPIKTQRTGQKQGRFSEQDRIVHVLNRLTFGPAPGDIARVQAMGIDKFIDEQLHPENLSEPQDILDFVGGSDPLSKNPDALFMEYGQPAVNALVAAQGLDPKSDEGKTQFNKIEGQGFRKVLEDTTKAKLMRAIESPRQLQEVITEFWFNHFNIYRGKGNDRIWLGAYEQQAIRPFALGKFRDLLGATCHHGAMIVYLDNATNSAPQKAGDKKAGLNENYARELMELHTLGVDGGYSQNDVIELARVLTGLTVSGHDGKTGELKTESNDFGSYFNARRHDMGDKVLLGQTIKGSGADEIEQALDMLAKQPATAKHICFQLAQYFVCDNPPPALVKRLAAKWKDSDGDIKVVLSELFHSREFLDPANAGVKFKSPFRHMVSLLRATGARPSDYTRVQQYLNGQGEPIYGCLTPDGYKNVKAAWLNPDALLHRANFAVDFTTGHFKGIDPGPLDEPSLQNTLGMRLNPATTASVDNAPPNLKAAVLLGSPEFMLY